MSTAKAKIQYPVDDLEFSLKKEVKLMAPEIIILILLAIISIILILSVVHISAKVDEIASRMRSLVEIAEKNNRENK